MYNLQWNSLKPKQNIHFNLEYFCIIKDFKSFSFEFTLTSGSFHLLQLATYIICSRTLKWKNLLLLFLVAYLIVFRMLKTNEVFQHFLSAAKKYLKTRIFFCILAYNFQKFVLHKRLPFTKKSSSDVSSICLYDILKKRSKLNCIISM